jgi:hypothetical protein
MICSNCNAEFDGDACPACGAAVTSPSATLLSTASQLLKEGLPDQAVEALEQVITRDPRSYEAHSLLGAAYMKLEEYSLAGHHFERAVWLDSGRAAARYNLALAYRAAGRLDDALQQVRAALEKDPQHEKSRALLRELEKQPDNGVNGADVVAGARGNRPRAAAPHLRAVQVKGERLTSRVRAWLGTIAAALTVIVGGGVYIAVFRLLTSPQLIGRDAVLWGQLPYAVGVMLFIAGVLAASFQVKGLPRAGAIGGLVGTPVAVAALLISEHEPVTARIVIGAAVFGALGAGVVEMFAKYTRAGEFRRVLLWVSIAGVAAYIGVSFVRQGSLRGYVTVSVADEIGRATMERVPNAEIVLTDHRSGRTYVTTSVDAQQAKRPASAEGSYALRGMPVGHYLLRCIEQDNGASWQGEVWVDYAIIQGNDLEISLTMPADKIRTDYRPRG